MKCSQLGWVFKPQCQGRIPKTSFFFSKKIKRKKYYSWVVFFPFPWEYFSFGYYVSFLFSGSVVHGFCSVLVLSLLIFSGAFDDESIVAHAYNPATLKYWGQDTHHLSCKIFFMSSFLTWVLLVLSEIRIRLLGDLVS